MTITKYDLNRLYTIDRTPVSYIMETYGMSRNAVGRWRKRYGIPDRKTRLQITEEKLRYMYSGGVSMTRICQYFGCTRSSIDRYRKKYDIPAREYADTTIQRFRSKVDRSHGHGPRGNCWVWTASLKPSGYGQFHHPGSSNTAHTASWIIHRGDIPHGKCVLHRCDNRVCVRPSHLFIGSVNDNNVDMVKKNRNAIGESVSQSKLTEVQVIAIRSRQMSLKDMAEYYGVAKSTISRILRRETWKHV